MGKRDINTESFPRWTLSGYVIPGQNRAREFYPEGAEKFYPDLPNSPRAGESLANPDKPSVQFLVGASIFWTVLRTPTLTTRAHYYRYFRRNSQFICVFTEIGVVALPFLRRTRARKSDPRL